MKRLLPLFLLMALSACSNQNGTGLPLPFSPSATPTLTPTPPPPTETPIPAAASVNGERIPLEEFNAELARYKQSQANLGLAVDDAKAASLVLEDLIAQVLLAQGAKEAGFVVDDPALQTRLDALSTQLGGAEALTAWQQAHGYTDENFRAALRRSVAAAWMRDKIASDVPMSAEQVHVRQILTYNENNSNRVNQLLAQGSEFEKVAALYDPITRGDIGWFPRGYLQLKAVEDAAFSLEVGAVSPMITTEIGFHVIKVMERQPDRPLSRDVRLALQVKAVADWVAARRQGSEIILAP